MPSIIISLHIESALFFGSSSCPFEGLEKKSKMELFDIESIAIIPCADPEYSVGCPENFFGHQCFSQSAIQIFLEKQLDQRGPTPFQGGPIPVFLKTYSNL